MKYQENLVWDKHIVDLIGYVDFGDANWNYATLQKSTDIATHILVFLLRSVVNRFKFSLASFVTTGATSSQMFPLVWKAISICELHLLKSLAVTCEWLKKMTWTQILMLHIEQSFYLVLKNVLSTSYLMFNIWWKQHETSIQFWLR